MKLGCDLVHIKEFGESLRKGGLTFKEKIFLPSEHEGSSLEHLAGIFAAKEAACKALGIPAGNWHNICVSNKPSGEPCLQINAANVKIKDVQLSISHAGEYALAVVIAT